MNTPVSLIFNKFDESDSTVEFINWLVENENELLKNERDIIIHAFDQGNTKFFHVASDGIEYFENTFYFE